MTVAVLAASLGTVALVQADDQPVGQPSNGEDTLLDKVATIYQQNTGTAIDAAELQNAFTQARQEMQIEARNQMLQKLVEDGVITQEQADEYTSWMDSKPAQALTDEYQQWLDSRPQDLPFGGKAMRGPMMRGFDRGGEMFGGFCFR